MPAPTTIPTPEIVTCHRLNERSSTGRSAVEPDVSMVIGRSFRTSAALVFEVLPAECPERHHDEEGRPDRKHYDRALDQLTDEQRNVIELQLAGLSGPAIAAAVGKSHDAVKMLRLRAVRRLRDVLILETEQHDD